MPLAPVSEDPPKPRKQRSGKLYVDAKAPERVQKKARTPKTVQKGLEAAFRKRQNAKLRETKPLVMDLFRRVLHQQLETRADLSTLFHEVSEHMSSLGVPLGGSEDWADRLYIEDKRGVLLFSEEELDVAEEAQKRMEVMYNVDSWTTQLSTRISSAQTLLSGGTDPHSGLTAEIIVERACKRLDEDLRYHTSVFGDSGSVRILEQIAALGLPNEIQQLGDELLAGCSAMLPVAANQLHSLAASCSQLKLKAMKAAAAQKILSSLERVRVLLRSFAKLKIPVPHEVDAALDEVEEEVRPLLPNDDAESDGEEYF